MSKKEFIYNLCHNYLQAECDPSKSLPQKNFKLTSLLLKDEDGCLVIFDKHFSINVLFEAEILADVLEKNGLKNVTDLADHSIHIIESNLELITFNNSKNSVNTKLVLFIKDFQLIKSSDKVEEPPKNVNYHPTIFYLTQEYIHKMLKKTNRAKHPTQIFDADSIINKTSTTKFESFKKVYEEKVGNIRNLKKLEDFHTNQRDFSYGNRNAEECRNLELVRIVAEDNFQAEEEEEDLGKENRKGRGKSSVEYPESLNSLMEKYSSIIPTIKKATILKFKSLKDQNDGN